MIEQAFEVATEFRFDVGQAIIGTKQLTGAVDDLSQSATSAFSTLNYLASGLVAHLGLGAGGLLGILTKAITLTEDFNTGSLGFVNAIGSNMQVLQGTIGSFNDQLRTSKMLMGNVADVAGSLGLSGGELAHMTNLLASPLAARGKLGTNFGTGIELAKNAMITGEATGLGTGAVGEALLRGLSPGGTIMGKLFERLVNTDAFRGAHVTRPSQLLNVNQDKKMDLIIKAMGELGNNAGYLTARLESLRVQFNILKSNVENILRPIGDALKVPILKIFKALNAFLTANAKNIGDSLGKVLGGIVDDPKKLFVNLMQLKSLSSDFKKALHMTELIQVFLFIRWGLGLLGVTLNGGLLVTGFRMLMTGLRSLAAFIWESGVLGGIFNLLKGAVVAVGEVFLPLLFFFQILSRARAIAITNDIVTMAELIPRFAAVWVKMKDALSAIFLPVTMAIDGVANMIAWIWEWGFAAKIVLPIFEGLADLLTLVGNVVIFIMATISGLVNTLIYAFANLMKLENPLKGFFEHASEGFDTFLKDHPPLYSGSTAVTKAVVTNNNHIEARFDMREQLEPDRIAFAVTQNLKKLAFNPTQGRRNSLSGGLIQ